MLYVYILDSYNKEDKQKKMLRIVRKRNCNLFLKFAYKWTHSVQNHVHRPTVFATVKKR